MIVGVALALFFGGLEDLQPLARPHLPWWSLAAAFLVAERCVVHLQFQRSAHSFSLGDLPLVFGLLFASFQDLMIGGLVGTALLLSMEHRLPPVKAIFNLGQLALAISLATVVVREFASVGDEIGPLVCAAVFLATQASALLTVLLIGLAISLSEFKIQAKTLGQMLALDLVVTVTNTSIALAGAVMISTEPWAIPLLLVPVATVFLAYRAYLLQQQKHEKLEFLYETTRTISRAPEIVLALEGLLARTLEAFRAEMAEIVLFSSDTAPSLRTTLGPGDRKEVMEPIDEQVADELRALVGDDSPGLMLSRPFGGERLRRYLDDHNVSDALVAMLPGEKRVLGTIMLANRVGVVRSFSEDDLRLFETLANNASVALQYDRLEQAVLQLRELQEQLHHQAFHDALTGLANRALFINQVKDALAKESTKLAVLFIDVDDFKTVNDSLGHTSGDELLVAVAGRLREIVRPSDVVARLGGDEFAVMIADRDPAGRATEVAERMVKTFQLPVAVGGREVNVHLSIGIATTRDGRRADELIRNADIAMYRAKDRGKGCFDVFDPSMRDAVLERHDLRQELETAINAGELALEYQPIVALGTGEVVAAEALVRWNHPGRGRLSPAEFVPLAEETGQIVAVGRFVLEEACRQARSWQQSGHAPSQMRIHVNLSAIELQDPAVVDFVISILHRTDLAPERLVLEITESVVQDDASVLALGRLSDIGVQLALDDFGTGYSSLSYLRSLPLDILKIARPFVHGLASEQGGSSFARMIIELAGALDLQIVAEGIESADDVEALRELGCEFGQGFYLGRPQEVSDDIPLGPAPRLAMPVTAG